MLSWTRNQQAIDEVTVVSGHLQHDTWGFPKIRGTILGAIIIRTIVYWGLYWGPRILGNYHSIQSSGACCILADVCEGP